MHCNVKTIFNSFVSVYAGTEVTKYFPKEYFDSDWHGETEKDQIIKQLQNDNKQLKLEIEALRKVKTAIKNSAGVAQEIKESAASKQLQDDNIQLKLEVAALKKDKTTVIKHSAGVAKEINESAANSNETDTAEHRALKLKKLNDEEAETRAEKQKFEEKLMAIAETKRLLQKQTLTAFSPLTRKVPPTAPLSATRNKRAKLLSPKVTVSVIVLSKFDCFVKPDAALISSLRALDLGGKMIEFPLNSTREQVHAILTE